ncbi:hypothetical protein AVEN_225426-1, partial [Araneus ventricosus]
LIIENCTHVYQVGFVFVEACPISDMTAQTVATALMSDWIARFGYPECITTDQGRQFEDKLFCQIARLFGTEKLQTSPYHPLSNDLIENWHRPLRNVP